MIHQYRGGEVPEGGSDNHIAATSDSAVELALEAFERFEFSKALETVWSLIGAVDKYIVEQAPWKLAKGGPECVEALDTCLYTAAEALRVVTALIYPVLPQSAEKIWYQLGMPGHADSVRVADLHWGHLPAKQKLRAVEAVFPRADAKVSIEKMKELETVELARQQTLLGKPPQAVAMPPSPAAAVENGSPHITVSQITIEDFAKVDLRVGVVKSAALVKGADKLLHLAVDIGEPQPRSIVAGIAMAYKPEALVGRKVVIVANLAPRKLRGLESQGMIVAASLGDGAPALASFLEDVPIGARLK
jgi:methionyl-tRNA synthetase